VRDRREMLIELELVGGQGGKGRDGVEDVGACMYAGDSSLHCHSIFHMYSS
jgi:hypothetical protein